MLLIIMISYDNLLPLLLVYKFNFSLLKTIYKYVVPLFKYYNYGHNIFFYIQDKFICNKIVY